MARLPGPGFVVAPVEGAREAADEARHGQVNLSVADVHGRVDEYGFGLAIAPPVTPAGEEEVDGPEVAVQE